MIGDIRLRHMYGDGLTGTAGEKAWICGPVRAWLGKAKPALVLHGNASDAKIMFESWAWAPYIAQRGFLVCTPDAAGPTNWGNPASTTQVGKALDKLNALGATGPAHIFAGSMGALTALNFARANPTRVASLALTTPALDLTKFLGAEVTAAYGTASPDPNLYSPVTYAVSLPKTLPIALWTADDDVVAPDVDHAAKFVAARPQTRWTRQGNVGGHAGGQTASGPGIFDWMGGQA